MSDILTDKEFEKLAKELGISVDVLHAIYNSQFGFMRDIISGLDIDYLYESKFNFNKERTSFNLPSFGKFYTSFTRINNAKYFKNKK